MAVINLRLSVKVNHVMRLRVWPQLRQKLGQLLTVNKEKDKGNCIVGNKGICETT